MMLLTAIMVLQKSGVRCIYISHPTRRLLNLLDSIGALRALCILIDYEL